MIYLEKPEGFNSKFEIVSCFFEHEGDILLLHRQEYKPQGNTWGVPAGKIEDGEDALQAMEREIKEETSYKVANTKPTLSKTVFVRYPEYDFVYHIFHLQLLNKPEIRIDSSAHKDFQWMSPADALNINLIPDLDACIKLQYHLEYFG